MFTSISYEIGNNYKINLTMWLQTLGRDDN